MFNIEWVIQLAKKYQITMGKKGNGPVNSQSSMNSQNHLRLAMDQWIHRAQWILKIMNYPFFLEFPFFLENGKNEWKGQKWQKNFFWLFWAEIWGLFWANWAKKVFLTKMGKKMKKGKIGKIPQITIFWHFSKNEKIGLNFRKLIQFYR